MYPDKLLTSCYRNLLSLTQGRGEHILAKADAFFFHVDRQISIDDRQKISIFLPPDPHFFRYLTKSHEEHINQAIRKLVKPGDTVVDVGANIGYFSACAVAAVGKQGRVFCLEPEATNFVSLQKNCKSIQNQGFTCSAYQLAASSTNGTAALNIHRYSTYHAIDDEYHQLDQVETQQIIHTITLEQWATAEGVQHISLLKIDTEGHEPKVLEGARKLFEKGAVDFVILECRDHTITHFIDRFCKNFKLYQLTWDGNQWCQAPASSLDYKTECLLSKTIICSSELC